MSKHTGINKHLPILFLYKQRAEEKSDKSGKVLYIYTYNILIEELTGNISNGNKIFKMSGKLSCGGLKVKWHKWPRRA